MPASFWAAIAAAAAIGYALPARPGLWLIVATSAVIAVAWLTYDGAFHNNPWPFLLTPPGIALMAGAAIRLAHGRLRAARAAGPRMGD